MTPQPKGGMNDHHEILEDLFGHLDGPAPGDSYLGLVLWLDYMGRLTRPGAPRRFDVG
jgi:hypothetical protein